MQKLLLIVSLLTFSFCQASTILIIQSYHKEYPWDAGYLTAIEQILQKNHKLLTFEMDTKRLPKSEYQKKADEAWEYFLKVNPDLVILGDDNAAKFLGHKIERTKKPLVFLGINGSSRNYFKFNNNNVSGILERPLLNRSIKVLSQIIGRKESKVLILLDNGTTSELIKKHLDTYQLDSAETVVENIGEWKNWQHTVFKAKEKGFDGAIIGLYHTIKDNGVHVPNEQVIEWTSKNSPIPLFAFWSFAVGKDKAIGGHVLDGYEHGLEAAYIAKHYLDNGEFKNIGSKKGSRGSYIFSSSELQRWNLKIPKQIRPYVLFVP